MLFFDNTRTLYNMSGEPLWYLPIIKGVSDSNIGAIRDIKLTDEGTITFLTPKNIHEIDYFGNVLWSGPNDGGVSGDTVEQYHHEITRLYARPFGTNTASQRVRPLGHGRSPAESKASILRYAGLYHTADEIEGESEPELHLLATYAYRERKSLANRFRPGEGLVGQCLLEKDRILLSNVPDGYVQISSGLGEAPPRNIIVLPVLFEGEVKAVIELASFQPFSENHLTFLDQLTESIGIVLNSIEANMRTEALLSQSQGLTQELQSQQEELTKTNRRLEEQARSLRESEDLLKHQQEELQQTNIELEEKARLLAEQKAEVEQKNRELDQARKAVEEKAEQLALTSKYKSEFLANMSHELRTPLNSMLILSRMLAENSDDTLTPKQVEYAETVHSSGSDLLALINEILDLSKIESGTMAVDIEPIDLAAVGEDMDRMFAEIANDKNLDFVVDLGAELPKTIETDEKRLQQVLKNLLSNAFKFTHEGAVTLRIAPADPEVLRSERLQEVGSVVGFSVIDTGVGITPEKHRVIFEAFQQADGSVNRDYGGTGLGLSISREIARLLGGEIHLESAPGEGSTFTLYLPEAYTPTKLARPAEEITTVTKPSGGPSAGASSENGSSGADAGAAGGPDAAGDEGADSDGDGGTPVPTAPDAGGDGAVPTAAPKAATVARAAEPGRDEAAERNAEEREAAAEPEASEAPLRRPSARVEDDREREALPVADRGAEGPTEAAETAVPHG